MVIIGKFEAKVYSTTDKKKLKDSTKEYRYGTISIRDPILTEFVGKKVIVRVEKKE